MKETKLTVRLPQTLVENAKRYARQQNTTVTYLIREYLRRIPAQATALENAPIVQKLSGTLSPRASIEDYKKHLADKHGAKN